MGNKKKEKPEAVEPMEEVAAIEDSATTETTDATDTAPQAPDRRIAYPVERIIRMKRFAAYRDLLRSVLVDDRLYTQDEVQQTIDAFMNSAKKED